MSQKIIITTKTRKLNSSEEKKTNRNIKLNFYKIKLEGEDEEEKKHETQYCK